MATSKIIKTLIILTTLLCCITLYAENQNAGTAAFAFLKMNYSARAMGMANAFTALANDADAVFFNSAGLVKCNSQHLKTTYMNYIDGMQGGSIAYLTESNQWKLAPYAQFMTSDAIDERDINNISQGTFYTSDLVLGMAVAKNVHQFLDLGLNFKYFYESLGEYSATAIAGDFSLLHQTTNKNLKIGATLKNFGQQLTYYTENKARHKMPMIGVGGASYNILDKAFVNVDVCVPFDNDIYYKVGGEVYLNPMFTLRTGIDSRFKDYKTGEDLSPLSGISFGVGFNWNQYMLDYAVSSMGGLGLVNQLSLSYRFN